MADKNVIDRIINAVLQVVVPDKIILFGSQARDQARPDSDYDILVIKSDIGNKLIVEQDIYEKIIGIDESIDILVRTPENIKNDKDKAGSFISRALKEGLVIYEH
jgi:uncharacterized protein